jgi:hypothetical protein
VKKDFLLVKKDFLLVKKDLIKYVSFVIINANKNGNS